MYFIVQSTYDDCFQIFFQDPLGYPSFYRLSELLALDEHFQDLSLIVPYPKKNTHSVHKIRERIQDLGLKSLEFGQNMETEFTFDQEGLIQMEPLFKQALELALTEFIRLHRTLPPSASAA